MGIFSTALAETAETTTELADALNELTSTEAAAAGAVVGAIVGVVVVITIIWFILQVIADWKIFTKAGQAGWKSIIPIYNYYVEYDLCWNGAYGLLYAVLLYVVNMIYSKQNMANWLVIIGGILCIGLIVLHIKESLNLAKSFGKGTGFGVCLILFGPIARMVLGFGKAQYVGKAA